MLNDLAAAPFIALVLDDDDVRVYTKGLERSTLEKVASLVEHLGGDTPQHFPVRGDAVEAWIKARRDQHISHSQGWLLLDEMLDEYRLKADLGGSLGEDPHD